jgi:hypothetical protein
MARFGDWKNYKAIAILGNKIKSLEQAPLGSFLTFANSHAETGPHNRRAQSRARFGNAL